jgi:predicted outer membrane protein
MIRRHILFGLTAIGAAGPLLPAMAQTQPSSIQPGTVQPLSAAEHLAMTLMAGTLSKQTSQLALTRAQNREVQQFGGFEASEQTVFAQVLTRTDTPPPVPLDAEHAAILASLQSLSGPAFDRAYVQSQILGHQELLRIQQGYLENSSRTPEMQSVAVLARWSILQHQAMLRDLQRMVGA